MLVATERLGWPGKESALSERAGLFQRHQRYPNEPDTATEFCHLQPADDQNALCGFPWEALVAVPGQPGWTDVEEELRCNACDGVRARE